MKHFTINANCNYVRFPNGDVVGFSYNTPVIAIINGQTYRTAKKWSVTTSRHIGKLAYELNTGGHDNAVLCDQGFLDTLSLSELH